MSDTASDSSDTPPVVFETPGDYARELLDRSKQQQSFALADQDVALAQVYALLEIADAIRAH